MSAVSVLDTSVGLDFFVVENLSVNWTQVLMTLQHSKPAVPIAKLKVFFSDTATSFTVHW